MKKQHDLFCWVLASLTLGGVTLAASTIPTAAPLSPPPTAKSAPVTSQARSPQAAPRQSGQIWECVTNGVKTFSNNPCGTRATRVALRPINAMKPTPVFPSARANGFDPSDAKEYSGQNSYPEQETSGQGFDESSSVQAYPGVQGFAYLALNRVKPDHRPMHHHDATSASPRRAAPHRPVAATRKN